MASLPCSTTRATLSTFVFPAVPNGRIFGCIGMAFRAVSLFPIVGSPAPEVVSVANDLKVRWPHAMTNATKMIRSKIIRCIPLWKRPDHQFIEPSVSEDLFGCCPKAPVAIPVELARPEPARTQVWPVRRDRADVDFCPEPVDQGSTPVNSTSHESSIAFYREQYCG